MNRYDLSLLFSRAHNTQPSVLSLYLNVDQSQSGNLNHGFEARLKKMASVQQKRLVDTTDRERFSTAMLHVRDYLRVSSSAAKGIVLFFDAIDGFFWHQEVGFVVTDQLRWDREPFLQPLAAALDQLETYGVVLADRAKFRLFVVSLGEAQEVLRDDGNDKRVRHVKTAGFNNPDSSSRIQRKADNQIRTNLRHLIRQVEEVTKARRIHRLILAGTREITRELRSLLPARLALNVLDEVDLSMKATASEVLDATTPVADNYERRTELEKVNTIITAAAKNGKAVVGLDRTLKAINSGRVWELIYAGGFVSPGYECSQCSALFSVRATRCPYCGARPAAVADVVERAVEHALRRQAKIEVVTADGSERLNQAGSIGAFLKTRTGSVAV
jgi:peptide subunit release factor 1 (eRF1)